MRPARAGPRGGGLLGCLLWLALVGAAVYVGVQIVAPYVRYWRFKDAMAVQAQIAARKSDVEIRRELTAAATELGIPLGPRDIRISRTRSAITISTAWSEEVVLPKYRRALHFQPQISAPWTPKPQ